MKVLPSLRSADSALSRAASPRARVAAAEGAAAERMMVALGGGGDGRARARAVATRRREERWIVDRERDSRTEEPRRDV